MGSTEQDQERDYIGYGSKSNYNQGLEMLKDLAKDLKDSYNERPELKLSGNAFWGLCQRVDLIVQELER